MPRLEIAIDDALDRAIAERAVRDGTSKELLAARILRDALTSAHSVAEDPLWGLVGTERAPHEHHDDVVYPR